MLRLCMSVLNGCEVHLSVPDGASQSPHTRVLVPPGHPLLRAEGHCCHRHAGHSVTPEPKHSSK